MLSNLANNYNQELTAWFYCFPCPPINILLPAARTLLSLLFHCLWNILQIYLVTVLHVVFPFTRIQVPAGQQFLFFVIEATAVHATGHIVGPQ